MCTTPKNIANEQPERLHSVDINYGSERLMFRWGIIFLVIALIAAALGFVTGWYGCRRGENRSRRRDRALPRVSLFMGRKRPRQASVKIY